MTWLGSIAAVLILVIGFAIWRLMQGPIELDWLAPYIEAALQRSGIGLKIGVSGVRLAIDRTTHQLDLQGQDVRLSFPDGQPLANFPEMSTSFALGALLHGRLMPSQLVIGRPVVHLARDAAGAFTAQIGDTGAAASELGPQMIEQLAGPRQSDAVLGLVQRLSIRGATVIVDDRGSGGSWRAERVDVAFERSGKGVRGDFSLAVPFGDGKPEVHSQFRYFADRQLLDLDLSIDGVEPAAIPPLIPELAQLQQFAAPVSGTLETRIDLKQAQAQGSRLDLTVGAGRLHSEWLAEGGVDIEKGELHAVYAPEWAVLRLDQLVLDLGGGTQLALSGTLDDVTPELIAAVANARPAGHVTGKLDAVLSHVPAARLGALWAPAFSPGGRRWALANIQDGVLDEASAQLSLDLDPVAHTANVLTVHGALRYHDLTVSYFPGLPPARKVSGTATLVDRHVQFVPSAGVLKGLKLTGGSLDITELGSPVEWLTVDLGVSGPIQDALEVLDSKPLYYAHAIGVDPVGIAGHADTQVHFKFPLLAALKLAEVDFGAKATIAGLSIDKIAMQRNLTSGNFGLNLDRNGVHLQGNARFDGLPATVAADLNFHPKTGPSAVYRVGVALDDDARRQLDFDFAADRLHGPIAVDLTYSALDGARSQAVVDLDLRGASLSIDEAGWKKSPALPATARLVVDLDHELVTRLPQIVIKAAGLDGRLGVELANGKQIERIDIRHLGIGENDFTGAVTRRPAGGWHADIHAARIDARHLFKQATSDSGSGSSVPLAVTARIDRLLLGSQRELGQVSAELLRSGGIWQSVKLDGRLGNGHQLALRLGEDGGRRLTLNSDDLGATVKLFGIGDNVIGGKLAVDAELAGTPGKLMVRGHIEGDDYTIVHAPVMARMLALPSLTGFASMLSGSGLPFSTLRGDFTYNGERVGVERLLAFGEALGVTASGWVDIDRDRLDLRGTVAPAYALNSLLGNIPIVGQLLVGGSQGLFAANYSISGPSADPDVAVNPLSALAPGILRQLFAPLLGFPPPQQEQQAGSPPVQSGSGASPR